MPAGWIRLTTRLLARTAEGTIYFFWCNCKDAAASSPLLLFSRVLMHAGIPRRTSEPWRFIFFSFFSLSLPFVSSLLLQSVSEMHWGGADRTSPLDVLFCISKREEREDSLFFFCVYERRNFSNLWFKWEILLRKLMKKMNARWLAGFEN